MVGRVDFIVLLRDIPYARSNRSIPKLLLNRDILDEIAKTK